LNWPKSTDCIPGRYSHERLEPESTRTLFDCLVLSCRYGQRWGLGAQRSVSKREWGRAVCSTNVAHSKDLYGVAYALCESGQYRKAQPIIERFLAGNPESSKGWCVASWAAYSIGDPIAGLEYAARAIALDPEKEWPVRSYSFALRGLGRTGRALEYARKAVELEPNEVLAWRCVADSARFAGLPVEAEDAAKRAMAIAPDSVHATYAMVAAAAVMDRARGIDIVLRALERQPNSVSLLRELAILYSAQGRLDEAADLFERVINQNPRDRDAHHWYLAVRGALGDEANPQRIREYFEQELRSSTLEIQHRPSDFRPYLRSANIARQLGRNEEAAGFAREASLHPPGEQYVAVWRAVAYSACRVEQWELAQFAMNQAFELDPSPPHRWIELAEVSLLSGAADRAIQWAQRVIDEQPLCTQVLKARAIIAQCLGDFGGASSCLESYVSRFPFASCSTSQLAQCRAEMGDRQGALDAWRVTSSQDPICACVWRQRAEASMTRVGIRLEH
jgi:tetratricopeptide (TPR) repeat protein